MKNRFAALLITLLGLSPLLPVQAGGSMFEILGKYEKISPPMAAGGNDTVEVMELFWYGCPHCFSFEPHVKRWLATKPKNVRFVRVPAVFRESWIPHARAYYTAESLGVLDRIHDPLFKAIHVDKRTISSPDQLADFFAEQGVDRASFKKTYDSFAVRSKVQRSIRLSRDSGIHGVPAVVVNGKYRTGGQLAGSYGSIIKVTNILVDEESKGLTAKVSTKDDNS